MIMKQTMKRIAVIVMAFVMLLSAAPVNCSASAAPSSLSLAFADAGANYVVLKWKGISGVKNYSVYRASGKGKAYKIKTIGKASAGCIKLKNRKLSQNKTYRYYVVANLKNGTAVKSNTKTKVRVRGNYKKGTIWGKSLNKKQRTFVKNKVAYFVNCKLDPSMSDVEKLKTTFLWLRRKTAYSMETRNYYNAYGLLHDRRASCYGYASAFKAIADAAGFDSRIVYANKYAISPNHAWNLVKVNGKWYVMDTQISTYIIVELECYDAFLIGTKNETYKYCYSNFKNRKRLPSVTGDDYSFTVTFKGMNGKTWRQRVKCGSPAKAPSAEKLDEKNYVFAGWDRSFSKIWGNCVIKARYRKNDSAVAANHVNGFRKGEGMRLIQSDSRLESVAYKYAKLAKEGKDDSDKLDSLLREEGFSSSEWRTADISFEDYGVRCEDVIDNNWMSSDYCLSYYCRYMGIAHYKDMWAVILVR